MMSLMVSTCTQGICSTRHKQYNQIHSDHVLRMGLEGTMVESGVSAVGSPTLRGAGLGFSCALCSPSVQFQDGGREVTCRSPMLEVHESEVRSFQRSPKTRERRLCDHRQAQVTAGGCVQVYG
jgi:hypothetical protein